MSHRDEYYNRTPEQSYNIWKERESAKRVLRWSIALPLLGGFVALIDYFIGDGIQNIVQPFAENPAPQLNHQATISLDPMFLFVPVGIFFLFVAARLLLANKEDSDELKRYKPPKQPKQPKPKKEPQVVFVQPVVPRHQRKSMAQLKQEEIDKQRQQYQEQQHREKVERSKRKSKQLKRLPGYVNVEQEKRNANNEFWKSIGVKSPAEYEQEERIKNIMDMHIEE